MQQLPAIAWQVFAVTLFTREVVPPMRVCLVRVASSRETDGWGKGRFGMDDRYDGTIWASDRLDATIASEPCSDARNKELQLRNEWRRRDDRYSQGSSRRD